jgi:hypothetical protein
MSISISNIESTLNELFKSYKYEKVKQVTQYSTRFVYRRPCDELNEFQVGLSKDSGVYILTVNMKDILYTTSVECQDDMLAYLKLHLELQ